jgi:hypothetical protein
VSKKGVVSWTILVLASLACGGFHKSEIVCEEAVVKIAECCPRVEIRLVNCDHDETCTRTHVPDVDEALAACVKRKDCRALDAEGVCAGIERGTAFQDVFGRTNTRFAGVCQ